MIKEGLTMNFSGNNFTPDFVPRLTPAIWSGVEGGAEFYDLSPRQFSEWLQGDIVHGAMKVDGMWGALSAVGSVGTTPVDRRLPAYCEGYWLEQVEGSCVEYGNSVGKKQSSIRFGATPGYKGSAGIKLHVIKLRRIGTIE